MMITCCNAFMDEQDLRREKLQAMVDAEGLSVVAKKFKKPDRQIAGFLLPIYQRPAGFFISWFVVYQKQFTVWC